eukprot:gene25656-33503_t
MPVLRRPAESAQYTSEQFQRPMSDNGITCSMRRSGNVWDNAAMESFFSSMKTERTARRVYRTRDEARSEIASTTPSDGTRHWVTSARASLKGELS